MSEIKKTDTQLRYVHLLQISSRKVYMWAHTVYYNYSYKGDSKI